MDDLISRQAAIDAMSDTWKHICYVARRKHPTKGEEAVYRDMCGTIDRVSSAQPEWNNYTVACLLAELYDDTCACNYNDIDDWLPEKCELLDSCPHPGGVACWEQFLKHKTERRSK